MKRSLIALALCIACTNKGGAEGEPPTDVTPPTTDVVASPEGVALDGDATASHRAFALDAHRALAGSGANAASSPLSMEMALGMLSAGAVGETSAELARLLRVSNDGSHHAVNQGILEAWSQGGRGYELAVANRIFAAKELEFGAEFEKITTSRYKATPETVDFAGRPEEARKYINSWVAGKTNDRIEELFASGDISESTRLTLVNATYFKGLWAAPFEPELTMPAPFTTPSGQEVEANYLRGEKRVLYAEDDDLQAVLIPYQGDGAGFLAILPKDSSKFSDLEASIDGERLRALTESMSMDSVDLWLPKVELNLGYDLREVITKMGAGSVLSSQADYSGIAKGPDKLVVDSAIHKVYLKIDEQGTEAAAATGIGVKATSLRQVPVFKADRPYLFAVWERELAIPIFVGRIADPSS